MTDEMDLRPGTVVTHLSAHRDAHAAERRVSDLGTALTRVRTELNGMLYVAAMLVRGDGRQDWLAAMRLQIVQAQNTLHVMDEQQTELSKVESPGETYQRLVRETKRGDR